MAVQAEGKTVGHGTMNFVFMTITSYTHLCINCPAWPDTAWDGIAVQVGERTVSGMAYCTSTAILK